MAATVTVDKLIARNETDSQYQEVRGTITLSGSYGGTTTHGDTLSFAGIYGIQSRSIPVEVDIFEAPPAGTAPNGYIFNFCPGTSQANGVLSIMNNLVELTQGSVYTAGLLAAVIKFKAFFPVFV
jgi:hypothetical protein